MPPARRHSPGLILIPAQTQARQTTFHQRLHNVVKPDGTEVRFVQGFSTVQNLNWGLRKGYPPSWVWLLGDDHEMLPDALTRLLDDDLDVVAPVCTLKQFPFTLLAFAGPSTPMLPEQLPCDRPVEVFACGSAGMLIRSHVLDAIGDPWFANSSGTVSDEDVQFCRRVRAAGFSVWVDGRVPFGHMGGMTAWPIPDGVGGWDIHLDLYGAGGKVVLDAPRPHIMGRARSAEIVTAEVSSPVAAVDAV